ncbi:nucleotidyltransferase domain-containing protein [Candidatus Lokiarchaeum ossiferum]|uniref:nucleotidyltransferase domain-containing protein n=1 Tax=Candidatus Lokiarchaeum ossiferum TaxID=2951803 RepID=UPI00352F801F
MVSSELIDQITNDFKFVLSNPNIKGVVLFGSYLTGDETDRSDIDICLVAPNQNLYQLHKFIYSQIEKNCKDYEIRFFEELPLYIQGVIIENGIVILSPDLGDLSEYFYSYRKQWVHEKWRFESLK